MDAVENNKYGWFWACPNGGNNCMYRHALPPGFVLKKVSTMELFFVNRVGHYGYFQHCLQNKKQNKNHKNMNKNKKKSAMMLAVKLMQAICWYVLLLV